MNLAPELNLYVLAIACITSQGTTVRAAAKGAPSVGASCSSLPDPIRRVARINYFPNKEAVVAYDRYDPMMLASLAAGPADEPLSVAVRRALGELAGVFDRDRDMILARARLGLEVPELRGRLWEELEGAQEQLCTVCAARSGRDPNDFELRVIAISLLAAAFEATREWVTRGGRGSMVELINQAFDAVQASARLDSLASPPN